MESSTVQKAHYVSFQEVQIKKIQSEQNENKKNPYSTERRYKNLMQNITSKNERKYSCEVCTLFRKCVLFFSFDFFLSFRPWRV